MIDKRWHQVTQLFTEALEIDDAKRGLWLEKACGEDRELLEEVNSLLQAYTSPGLPDLTIGELRKSALSWMEMQDKKDTQIGAYILQELIGAGGMGVVYRARDTRLNRDVAIKFPPPIWNLNKQTKEQFLHEARAAASLDHPNICTIYEADELNDGNLYMAMAFYNGQTLRSRMENNLPEIEEALDIALQTARGLAAAHDRGLVHRDIKPANLMLTDNGTLKILDFGIAMAVDSGLPVTGQRPGTLAYMAPEQARGEEVDERADLWSLGVVLYEVLTGKLPEDNRTAPSTLRPEIPAQVDDLILRLLESDPDKRLKSAEKLVAALLEIEGSTGQSKPFYAWELAGKRRLKLLGGYTILIAILAIAGFGSYLYVQGQSAAGLFSEETTGPYTLAVLPFSNMSNNPDDEYFSDGITEDLLAFLSRKSDFRVLSRAAVMRFKETDRNVTEIGRELGATHIMEGSVRRLDERVRITAQLIDASTGLQLWAERYDREQENILTIQADIARSIAENLEGHLLSDLDSLETEIINPKAHDLYLQGRYHWHRRSEAGLRRAAQYFEEAVELEPGYSTAWEGLADAYAVLGFYDYLSPDDSFRKAREAARRALDLKPNSASAWASLGYVALYYEWDLEWGEAAFRRSINLDPRYSKAHQWYANLLTVAGRFDEAEQEMLHAQELDPLSLIANAALGWTYYHAGRYEDAIEQFNLTLELNSDFELAYLWSGWTLELMQQYDEALEMLEEAVVRSDSSDITVASLARLHGIRGETKQAEALLAGLEEAGRYVPAYEISKAYMGLNRQEQALKWLERAMDERSHSMVFLEVDPQIEMHLDNTHITQFANRIWGDSSSY